MMQSIGSSSNFATEKAALAPSHKQQHRIAARVIDHQPAHLQLEEAQRVSLARKGKWKITMGMQYDL